MSKKSRQIATPINKVTKNELKSMINKQLKMQLDQKQIEISNSCQYASLNIQAVFSSCQSILISKLTISGCKTIPYRFPSFHKLKKLCLTQNYIKSLQFIQNIEAPNLNIIQLDQTDFYSIKPLRKMVCQLHNLSIRNSRINDFEYLRQVKFENKTNLAFGNRNKNLNYFDWLFSLQVQRLKSEQKLQKHHQYQFFEEPDVRFYRNFFYLKGINYEEPIFFQWDQQEVQDSYSESFYKDSDSILQSGLNFDNQSGSWGTITTKKRRIIFKQFSHANIRSNSIGTIYKQLFFKLPTIDDDSEQSYCSQLCF